MRRETALAGAIALLVATMAVGAIAVPGALSEPRDDARESYLSLQEPYVDAHDVSGRTVTLSLSSRLEHRGGTAENVTVETRAIDTETGLVETTERQSLGEVSGDRDVPFTTNLTVERAGGYRIETTVFADEQRQTGHRGEVSNLGALTPDSARSPIGFHDFENTNVPLEAISYRILSVEDNRTRMEVTTYLTNTGDETTGGLDLRLRARQADSNVIADESTLRIGEIRPSRTETVTTTLTVPDGYDYWLDGILSVDGVIVATESSVADLNPEETLTEDETRRDVGFESDDFAEQETEAPRADSQAPQETEGASGPGFTALTAVVALLVAAVIRRYT